LTYVRLSNPDYNAHDRSLRRRFHALNRCWLCFAKMMTDEYY
jgi:hypothetical protein